jgi:hypothetical protein
MNTRDKAIELVKEHFPDRELMLYIKSSDLVYESILDTVQEALNIDLVSEMFDFAGYLYGNFDYHDNTKDGDIYIHNDNNLKYTRDKIYQQWLGTRNSR